MVTSMKIFLFAAILAVASAGRFANRASELTIGDPHEFEELQGYAKPAVKIVELCDNGADIRNEDFTPVGGCHFLVEEICDPAKHGMFWFSEGHSSVYSKCKWNPPSPVAPGYCEFNPIDYCKYTWEEEEYDLLRQVEKLVADTAEMEEDIGSRMFRLTKDMNYECQRPCSSGSGSCMHEGEGNNQCTRKNQVSEGGTLLCPHGFFDCDSVRIPAQEPVSFRRSSDPDPFAMHMGYECQQRCEVGYGDCMHEGEGDITCRGKTVKTETGLMVCTAGYVDCKSPEMQEAIETYNSFEAYVQRVVDSRLFRNRDITQECQTGCYAGDGPCMHEGTGDQICSEKIYATETGNMICPHGFFDCSSLPAIPGGRDYTSFRKFNDPANMVVECQQTCDSGVGNCMHESEDDITCTGKTTMTETGMMVCPRGYVDCASAEMQEAIQAYNDEQAWIQSIIDSRTALRRRDITQECQTGCYAGDGPCMHEGTGDQICSEKIYATETGNLICPHGFFDCSSLPAIPGGRNYTSFRKFNDPANMVIDSRTALRRDHDDIAFECQTGCHQNDGPCMHEGTGDNICVNKIATETGLMVCPHGFFDCSLIPAPATL